MIGKLTGAWGGASVEGAALLEVGGVGYSVRVPLPLVEGTAPGATVSLFIHTAVRADSIELYGFGTEEELAFFKLLTTVSGLGPKSALGILNAAEVAGLKRAIRGGDAGALHKLFGIGRKTAERITLELRDKLGPQGGAAPGGTDAEVTEALTSLGYKLEEAREALKGLGTEGAGDVRARLSAALKRLGTHTRS